MTDTLPEIQKRLIAMMRAKTGVERLKMGLSMFDMSKKLATASILLKGQGDDVLRQLLIRFYRNDLDLETIDKIANHCQRC